MLDSTALTIEDSNYSIKKAPPLAADNKTPPSQAALNVLVPNPQLPGMTANEVPADHSPSPSQSAYEWSRKLRSAEAESAEDDVVGDSAEAAAAVPRKDSPSQQTPDAASQPDTGSPGRDSGFYTARSHAAPALSSPALDLTRMSVARPGRSRLRRYGPAGRAVASSPVPIAKKTPARLERLQPSVARSIAASDDGFSVSGLTDVPREVRRGCRNRHQEELLIFEHVTAGYTLKNLMMRSTDALYRLLRGEERAQG